MSKGQKKYPVRLNVKITKKQEEHLKLVYGEGGASQFVRFCIDVDIIKKSILDNKIDTPTIMKNLLLRDWERFSGSVPEHLMELYSLVSGIGVEDLRGLCQEAVAEHSHN